MKDILFWRCLISLSLIKKIEDRIPYGFQYLPIWVWFILIKSNQHFMSMLIIKFSYIEQFHVCVDANCLFVPD